MGIQIPWALQATEGSWTVKSDMMKSITLAYVLRTGRQGQKWAARGEAFQSSRSECGLDQSVSRGGETWPDAM